MMPLEVGLVYWVALGPPCTSVYLPFHFGVEDLPSGYVTAEEAPTISNWQARVSVPFQPNAGQAYWSFNNFHKLVFDNYAYLEWPVKRFINQFQDRAFILQDALETPQLISYFDPKLSHSFPKVLVTNYDYGLYLQAIEGMGKVLTSK